MRRDLGFTFFLAIVLSALGTSPSGAADLEAFEFNDSDFTELNNAANSVNPGNNWSDGIATSAVTGGVFFIGKDNNDFSTSHLQIDDINDTTVGSRYIVAELSGWDIRGFDAAEPEQLRFSFLDDNTGTGGSRVTAQIQIERNTTTEAIEIEGNSLGLGSSNLPANAVINTTQTAPFVMVLELNKTSNSYEVFYKDGSNPSQSLGLGSVAPDRNGNSVRMVVNNNFGSDFSESINVDRVAITDSNPLTDLITLEVDRSSGAVTLVNTSGASVSGVTGYSITSEVGSVASGLTPFSGTLANGQEVVLSNSGGWIQNPTEDWQMTLNLSGGGTRSVNVDFVENSGEKFAVGDLTFDGALTVDDWTLFIAGAETDLSGLSVAEAYQSGDLDGDGINSIGDFGVFEAAFDAANGAGSFQALLASVPEPTSVVLCSLAGVCLASIRRRH